MPTNVARPAPVFPEKASIPEDVRVEYYAGGAQYLVNGEIRNWTGPMQEVASPVHVVAGGEPEPHRLGHYPLMTEEESRQALDAACRAWAGGCGEWPTMSVADRIACVQRFIPRMQAVRDEVVKLLMWEIGKTLPDARKEFDRTVEYIRDTIDALKTLDRASSQFVIQSGFLAQIRRSPLGPTLCMGPFNYPLNETFTTLIPALIMGNPVVFKPPKYGVLLHAPLLKAFAESFPPGVVNTVYGDGATVVGPMMTSGEVNVLAFIGSAKVASILKHQHPKPNRLRCVFGLEAKNPGVILPHADLDTAVAECVQGSLSYNGQRCTAIKVIFVHRSLADEFCARFAAAVGELRVGMPWEDGVKITPLPEEGKADWLKSLVDEAVAGGAKIINANGGAIDRSLYYPAVVYPAKSGMRICQVEQFGPVVPIIPYDDVQEVLDWVMASPHGQQAALFGSDPEQISKLIDPFVNLFCRVNINSQCQRGPDTFPFVGRKDSAENTLSVSDALRVFSIRSLVATKTTEQNQQIVSDIVRSRCSKFLSTDFIF